MKGTMKKIMAVAAALIFVLSMSACSKNEPDNNAADSSKTESQTVSDTTEKFSYTKSGDLKGNFKWYFDENSGKLVIEGKGEMETVTDYETYPWDAKKVKSVEIKDGITSVDRYLFTGTDLNKNGLYEELESIEIADSVKEIDRSAIAGLPKLKSINIPANVVFVSIENFNFCNSLEKFTVDSNNQTYQSIDGVLYSENGSVLERYPEGKSGKVFVIPDTVETLNYYSFMNSSIEEITIPKSVSCIVHDSFTNCNIKKIHFKGTEDEWNALMKSEEVNIYDAQYLTDKSIEIDFIEK